MRGFKTFLFPPKAAHSTVVHGGVRFGQLRLSRSMCGKALLFRHAATDFAAPPPLFDSARIGGIAAGK